MKFLGFWANTRGWYTKKKRRDMVTNLEVKIETNQGVKP